MLKNTRWVIKTNKTMHSSQKRQLRRRRSRRRRRQQQQQQDPIPHDFVQVYTEYLENLRDTLPSDYTDLLKQRISELGNPGQAQVLYDDFKQALQLIAPAILSCDESAILRCPKEIELVKGIDFRVIYPILSEASRKNFWMFLQILSLMTGNQHSVLWENVMKQVEDIQHDDNDEHINVEELSRKVKELCGLRGETESEQVMEGLITSLTSQVIENPMAVLQSLQNPASMQQLFGTQMEQHLSSSQVNQEEMKATVENLANSIHQQMPDLFQSLMPKPEDTD